MYDIQEQRFKPVPEDRPLTDYEEKLTKFSEGERLYLKGMAFTITEIHERTLVLAPVLRP